MIGGGDGCVALDTKALTLEEDKKLKDLRLRAGTLLYVGKHQSQPDEEELGFGTYISIKEEEEEAMPEGLSKMQALKWKADRAAKKAKQQAAEHFGGGFHLHDIQFGEVTHRGLGLEGFEVVVFEDWMRDATMKVVNALILPNIYMGFIDRILKELLWEEGASKPETFISIIKGAVEFVMKKYKGGKLVMTGSEREQKFIKFITLFETIIEVGEKKKELMTRKSGGEPAEGSSDEGAVQDANTMVELQKTAEKGLNLEAKISEYKKLLSDTNISLGVALGMFGNEEMEGEAVSHSAPRSGAAAPAPAPASPKQITVDMLMEDDTTPPPHHLATSHVTSSSPIRVKLKVPHDMKIGEFREHVSKMRKDKSLGHSRAQAVRLWRINDSSAVRSEIHDDELTLKILGINDGSLMWSSESIRVFFKMDGGKIWREIVLRSRDMEFTELFEAIMGVYGTPEHGELELKRVIEGEANYEELNRGMNLMDTQVREGCNIMTNLTGQSIIKFYLNKKWSDLNKQQKRIVKELTKISDEEEWEKFRADRAESEKKMLATLETETNNVKARHELINTNQGDEVAQEQLDEENYASGAAAAAEEEQLAAAGKPDEGEVEERAAVKIQARTRGKAGRKKAQEEEVAQIRQQLIDIYQDRNPKNIGEVDQLMETWRGREKALLQHFLSYASLSQEERDIVHQRWNFPAGEDFSDLREGIDYRTRIDPWSSKDAAALDTGAGAAAAAAAAARAGLLEERAARHAMEGDFARIREGEADIEVAEKEAGAAAAMLEVSELKEQLAQPPGLLQRRIAFPEQTTQTVADSAETLEKARAAKELQVDEGTAVEGESGLELAMMDEFSSGVPDYDYLQEYDEEEGKKLPDEPAAVSKIEGIEAMMDEFSSGDPQDYNYLQEYEKMEEAAKQEAEKKESKIKQKRARLETLRQKAKRQEEERQAAIAALEDTKKGTSPPKIRGGGAAAAEAAAASAEAEQAAAEPDIMSQKEARERLESVYTEHNPSKIQTIPGLLEKYAANPGEIVAKVEEKYLTPPPSAAATTEVQTKPKPMAKATMRTALPAGKTTVKVRPSRKNKPASPEPAAPEPEGGASSDSDDDEPLFLGGGGGHHKKHRRRKSRRRKSTRRKSRGKSKRRKSRGKSKRRKSTRRKTKGGKSKRKKSRRKR